MHSNKFAIALARFELVIILCYKIAYAYPSTNSNEPSKVNDSGRNGDYGSGHVVPQFNFHYAQQQNQTPHENQKQQQHPNLTYFITSKANSTSTSLSSLSAESASPVISTKSAKPILQSAYVYKAVIPTHIEPAVSAVKSESLLLSSSTTTPSKETSHTGHATNSSNINSEKDDELSKKIIGSR